jgi:hypothetical protein
MSSKCQRQGLCFDPGIQGVNFFLNVDGELQGRHNAAVRADIVQFQTPFPPILEPLLAHLITAYSICPPVFGHGGEILGRIDIHPLIPWIISQPFLLLLADALIPIVIEPARGRIQFIRFQEIQHRQPLHKPRHFQKDRGWLAKGIHGKSFL